MAFCRRDSDDVETCVLPCEENVYYISVAIDIGLLTPEQVQRMCTEDTMSEMDELAEEVMAFSCEGQNSSCCILAGMYEEPFRPADVETCNFEDGCGMMELCSAKPGGFLMDMEDQDADALMTVCRALGGRNRGLCRAITWRGESVCETSPVCSELADEDEGGAVCSEIAQGVASCVDGSGEDSEGLIACLSDMCGDNDSVMECYNTVMEIIGQVEAGWSLADLPNAIRSFESLCRWSSLAPVLGEVLDCDEGPESCDWNVPSSAIPKNPFERRLCTDEDHCCIGGYWQIGPLMCEDTAGCRFRGNANAGTGTCYVDEECSACSECIATMSAVPLGTSADGYLAACQQATSGDGEESYCGVLQDWEEWLEGTTADGLYLPNYKAACSRLGFCPDRCIGESLCPAEEEGTAPVESSIPEGYCQTKRDCSGEDDRCLPFEDADDGQQCEELFTCDDETGFFQAKCLGTCVSKSEAACAVFRQSRVDTLFDLLYRYSPEDAEGIEAAYDAAMDGAPDEAAEEAAEEDMVSQIELMAGDLEAAVCFSPDDCIAANETCKQDKSCKIFNKICDSTGVVDLCVPAALNCFRPIFDVARSSQPDPCRVWCCSLVASQKP